MLAFILQLIYREAEKTWEGEGDSEPFHAHLDVKRVPYQAEEKLKTSRQVCYVTLV